MATLVIGVFAFTLSHLPVTASAPRISISPTSVTLPENGGSQLFSVSLSEPIIAMSGDPNVVVTLTSSESSVTVSPSTITFLHDQWYVPQSFTVTTLGLEIANPYDAVTIGLSAASGAEYYNGYTSSIPITLIDGNRIAPVLTEVTPIPNQVTSSDVAYHFSTAGDSTDYSISSDCPDGTVFDIPDGTVSFHNLTVGQTYGDCNFSLALNLYPSSNVLHIGSFTATNPPQLSSGFVSGGSSDITWTPETGFVYHNTSPVVFSTSKYHFTKLLKKGTIDADVIQLQKYLAEKGFSVTTLGRETSLFGPKTKTELSLFQKSVGITPTGILGSLTQVYINSHP